MIEGIEIPELSELERARFWSKVNVKDKYECWNWLNTTSSGYGRFRVGKQYHYQAHRVSFQLFNGRFPNKKLVLHKCDNKLCVNPNHLFSGTHRENAQDMVRKGRHVGTKGQRMLNVKKGEDSYNHKLTNSQVLKIREIFAGGYMSNRAIGRKFNISDIQVGNIVKRKCWTHI